MRRVVKCAVSWNAPCHEMHRVVAWAAR